MAANSRRAGRGEQIVRVGGEQGSLETNRVGKILQDLYVFLLVEMIEPVYLDRCGRWKVRSRKLGGCSQQELIECLGRVDNHSVHAMSHSQPSSGLREGIWGGRGG